MVPYPVERIVPVEKIVPVPFPVKTPISNPVPFEIVKHTPIQVDKPLKYIQQVHIPHTSSNQVKSEREGLSGGYQ